MIVTMRQMGTDEYFADLIANGSKTGEYKTARTCKVYFSHVHKDSKASNYQC